MQDSFAIIRCDSDGYLDRNLRDGQTDCKNTDRLQKHRSFVKTQTDCKNTDRLQKHRSLLARVQLGLRHQCLNTSALVYPRLFLSVRPIQRAFLHPIKLNRRNSHWRWPGQGRSISVRTVTENNNAALRKLSKQQPQTNANTRFRFSILQPPTQRATVATTAPSCHNPGRTFLPQTSI
jgi:hypothetical protein